MVMGEQNRVNIRKIFEVDGGICQSGSCDTGTKMDMVASMKKVGLGSC